MIIILLNPPLLYKNLFLILFLSKSYKVNLILMDLNIRYNQVESILDIHEYPSTPFLFILLLINNIIHYRKDNLLLEYLYKY